jgi:hypothetical protein
VDGSDLGSALFPVLGTLAAPGELSRQLWLIVFGPNSQHWTEANCRHNLRELR